jgi:hypothetical protein
MLVGFCAAAFARTRFPFKEEEFRSTALIPISRAGLDGGHGQHNKITAAAASLRRSLRFTTAAGSRLLPPRYRRRLKRHWPHKNSPTRKRQTSEQNFWKSGLTFSRTSARNPKQFPGYPRGLYLLFFSPR